jgi:hypothetical protein
MVGEDVVSDPIVEIDHHPQDADDITPFDLICLE